MASSILHVAVPVPLPHLFDYRLPVGEPAVEAGQRVLVRFGRRRLVGVVMAADDETRVRPERLRAPERVLDDAPILDAASLSLLSWSARYYHYPIGEVAAAALPTAFRKADTASGGRVERYWQVADSLAGDAEAELARAPRQRELLALLKAHGPLAQGDLPGTAAQLRQPLQALERRGWIIARAWPAGVLQGLAGDAPEPTDAQQQAVDAITALPKGFAPVVVEGVTGSGKTELYLRRMANTLAAGGQVLFLAPEIGLTPQLVERIRQRFAATIGVLHSQRSEGERASVWQAAGQARVDIVIGTRSAVFTPMPRLGLIVIDEAHDGSFKQQDGFLYHARDVALKRAQWAGVEILLGSATPSLETLHNIQRGRFTRVHLPERATGSVPPIRLIDIRSRRLQGGLSEPLLERIAPHLQAGNQVLIFINRRGFAPALACHDCGWIAHCERCDAPLTVHHGGRRLVCHHCGARHAPCSTCGACGSEDLRALGAGTERVAGVLRACFPEVRMTRFDRDSMMRKGRLEAELDSVARGTTQLLVGTQMLAKGHDFARLTCVGVLDVDGGLFSADFRAAEHMAQLTTQVAGRAGRADRPSEVWLQTRHPDHPLLARLLQGGYAGFAEGALAERRATGLPPYGHIALLRAEAVSEQAPVAFLNAALAAAAPNNRVECWGPVPAPMPRRAGRYRAHLLLQSARRGWLHPLLDHWQQALPSLPEARHVRWSIDVDPQDMS